MKLSVTIVVIVIVPLMVMILYDFVTAAWVPAINLHLSASQVRECSRRPA